MSILNSSSNYHKPRVDDQQFWTQPTVEEAGPLVEPTQYRGRFRKGYDPRRHVFTAEERSAGFWTAITVMGLSIGKKLHKSGRWPNFRKVGSSR